MCFSLFIFILSVVVILEINKHHEIWTYGKRYRYCICLGLNLGPMVYKPSILPTELKNQSLKRCRISDSITLSQYRVQFSFICIYILQVYMSIPAIIEINRLCHLDLHVSCFIYIYSEHIVIIPVIIIISKLQGRLLFKQNFTVTLVHHMFLYCLHRVKHLTLLPTPQAHVSLAHLLP